VSRRVITMDRFLEIKRQLELAVPIIQIARSLGCTERTIREIRDGSILEPSHAKEIQFPAWSEKSDWALVLEEVLAGHPFKFIWDERFTKEVGYKAFLDQFHKRYPHYKRATTVHRYFAPGERCEVDYAGDTVRWINLNTGEIVEMQVFIGTLGFSQKIYAEATSDQKSRNFIESHSRMYKAFGGVPKITVPDCLKQGVTRTHLYDPNINHSYQAMAKDFGTAIVPARPRKPKDKSLVELAVKLTLRLYRWRFRKTTPTSPEQVNAQLAEVTNIINSRPHSRFKISRNASWMAQEQSKLAPLPAGDFEYSNFKGAKVHDDCYIEIEHNYYSCPKEYRGHGVQAKITERRVEVFYDLERIAVHDRHRGHHGAYVTENSYLPENARAYLEATPQNVLSQARFISQDLHRLIDELFQENTIAHLPRALGFVRKSREEIRNIGSEKAKSHIGKAIDQMKMFNKIRVGYFQELLAKMRTEIPIHSSKIQRQPNPNLRHTGGPQLVLITNNLTEGDPNGTPPN
jgi:transposase